MAKPASKGFLKALRKARRSPPPAPKRATARRLRRGSDPKRGAPGRNRTIRCPDDLWALFKSAADAEHISVAEYLIQAGEQGIDERNARALGEIGRAIELRRKAGDLAGALRRRR